MAKLKMTYMPPDNSEGGDGIVFSRLHKGDVAFTPGLGWLRWNQYVWEASETQVFGIARDDSKARLEEAQAYNMQATTNLAKMEGDETADPDELKRAQNEVKNAKFYLSHAKAGRKVRAMKNVLEAAKPDFEKPLEAFDADWDLLNTPKFVVDLKSGKHLSSNPELYMTRSTAVSPNYNGMEVWAEHINRITHGDMELADGLQMIIGSFLFGRVFYEGIYFMHGIGNTGKSTTFNTLYKVLGTYSASFDVDTLVDISNTAFKRDAACLRGVRYCLAGELEAGRRLSVAALKRMTSKDVIHAEAKYFAPIDYTPSHHTVVFTNVLPRVATFEDATWRRIRVVPFRTVFQGADDIPNYEAFLFERCGGAVLQWAIDGAVKFAANGFKIDMPEAVKQETLRYKRGQNWLLPFLNSDRVDTNNPNVKTRTRDLYDCYQGWAAANNATAYSEAEFAQAMRNADFVNKKPGNVSTWHGIQIVPDTPIEPL